MLRQGTLDEPFHIESRFSFVVLPLVFHQRMKTAKAKALPDLRAKRRSLSANPDIEQEAFRLRTNGLNFSTSKLGPTSVRIHSSLSACQ